MLPARQSLGPRIDAVISWPGVVAIVSTLTIVRFWAAAHAGLAPDETYYWLWSQTPALGYSDHPPMVAWWIWLSTRTLGDTALGVRVLPILSALVTSIAVFGIARQLFSARSIALRATLWFNAMILIGVGVIFSTPDAPSTMFWALAVWALSAIWRTKRPWLWLLVGLFAGFGCVSKYTNLFLGLGIVAWLSVDPTARRWLGSPWLWAGGFIALIIFLPVVLWNAQHDWISFSKQFGRLAAHQITLRYLGELLVSQLGLLNPIIALFFVLAIAATLGARSDSKPEASVFLLTLMAPLALYMIVHAFHDRVQANWLAPLYPLVALLAAAGAENLVASPFRAWLAHAVVPLGSVVSVFTLLYLAAPVYLPLSIRSPTERLEGWLDFAAEIELLRQRSDASWIATVNYDVNAELAFYEQGLQPVREITERERYSPSPVDATLANQPALLVMSEKEKASGRYDGCFTIVEPISVASRQGANGLIERYIVERVVSAPADIISAGCHLHPAITLLR
jgi:4-amino-4-deoxy-L-arabinose transferase-like glycosyltransferase